MTDETTNAVQGGRAQGTAAAAAAERQRRFLAFSFTAADILIETDREAQVVFAMGATSSLSGLEAGALPGRALPDLFAAHERALVRRLIARAQPGQRFGPLLLEWAQSGRRKVALSGCCFPDRPETVYLSVSEQGAAFAETPEVERDATTGLLTEAAFGAQSAEAMAAAERAGQALEMTLLDTGDLSHLKTRLGEDRAAEFFAEVGAFLRENAFNDMSARLSDTRFGVMHGKDCETGKRLSDGVAALAREADPEGRGIVPETASVECDAGMEPADAARAVAFTVKEFASGRRGLTDGSLREAMRDLMLATHNRIAELKTRIRRNDIALVAQPIVDLVSGEAHHYEVLARFKGNSSPAEDISFAESVGLIHEFDYAICSMAVAALRQAGRGCGATLAVNLSGHSVENGTFMSMLLTLLKKERAIVPRLMFEVTETAGIEDLARANQVLQNLRRLGAAVCIDDFGSGSASFQYLNAMDVDYLKIDGQYVTGLGARPKEEAMLKAMNDLCHMLGMKTIAEMIETEDVAARLGGIGIDLGQGYHFARPAPIGDVLAGHGRIDDGASVALAASGAS